MAAYDIPAAVHRAVLAGTDRIPTPRAQEGEVSRTEIPVITHELLRVLEGNVLTVRTLDGQDVTLRLATPDEVLRFERESRAAVAAMGVPIGPSGMTQERAADLCAPLILPWNAR